MSALRIERDGELLRVAMARPERRNAFDAALIGELTEAFGDVGDARAVVLSGDGPSFSAGADVEWMRSSVDALLRRERRRRAAAAGDARRDRRLPRSGGRARAGACARWRRRARRVLRHRGRRPWAQFAFSEVKLGIVPAVISPFALAKIGPSAARRYFVTGERFDAETALRIGLVHEVAADLDGSGRAGRRRALERRPDRSPHREGSRRAHRCRPRRPRA